MIRIQDYPIFLSNMSTLKETSKDKHDNGSESYMTDSLLPAVNFDDVKGQYIENLGLCETPKSNDALMENGEGKILFIEFKNGYMDKVTIYGVRKKIYDSVLIFSDIASIGISSMRKCVEYILVYNEKENPGIIEDKKKHVQKSQSFDSIAKTLSGYANEEYVGFGVNIFKKYCFKDVHTYTEKEFEQYLNHKCSKVCYNTEEL